MESNIAAYTFKDSSVEVSVSSSHRTQGIFHHSGISVYFAQHGSHGKKNINYQSTSENIIRTVNRILNQKPQGNMTLTDNKHFIPVYRNNDSTLRLLSGKFKNMSSKILLNRTMMILEVKLDQSSRFIIEIPEENNVLVAINKTGKYDEIFKRHKDCPLQISRQNGYLSILSPQLPINFVIVSGKRIEDNLSELIGDAYFNKADSTH